MAPPFGGGCHGRRIVRLPQATGTGHRGTWLAPIVGRVDALTGRSPCSGVQPAGPVRAGEVDALSDSLDAPDADGFDPFGRFPQPLDDKPFGNSRQKASRGPEFSSLNQAEWKASSSSGTLNRQSNGNASSLATPNAANVPGESCSYHVPSISQ